jgi:hypothetical protein
MRVLWLLDAVDPGSSPGWHWEKTGKLPFPKAASLSAAFCNRLSLPVRHRNYLGTRLSLLERKDSLLFTAKSDLTAQRPKTLSQEELSLETLSAFSLLLKAL